MSDTNSSEKANSRMGQGFGVDVTKEEMREGVQNSSFPNSYVLEDPPGRYDRCGANNGMVCGTGSYCKYEGSSSGYCQPMPVPQVNSYGIGGVSQAGIPWSNGRVINGHLYTGWSDPYGQFKTCTLSPYNHCMDCKTWYGNGENASVSYSRVCGQSSHVKWYDGTDTFEYNGPGDLVQYDGWHR